MWWFFYQIELVGKQLEESIKPLALGSWFYAFLSLFANSFNLVRYSSRGGQEKPLDEYLNKYPLEIIKVSVIP